MTGQRMAVYAGVLATTIGAAGAGLGARAHDQQTSDEVGQERRVERDRRQDRRVVVAPRERQVIRLDGRGSQLGVMVSDLESQNESGVRIDEVDEDSSAEKAGVRAGDIVVEFDGERVRSARQLTRLVQETPAGRSVKMTVVRGSDRQTLDVTPERREALAWSGRMGPEFEREIEPFLNFRLEGLPSLGARGRLGVQVDNLSDQLAEHFGARDGGVLVAGVTADSPAARAGLKAGDVITKVNGAAVKNPGDLIEALGAVKDDGAVTLDIVRDKLATSLKATIERPRPSRPAPSPRPA
ncbi:MAG: PDZ domain-containing protein [Acidobacteria bacterium]|nr:PDZ domain-containing protein [Acidobacteriota bacterium]